MRSGQNNPNWKGGKTVTEHGYVLVRVGRSHHLSDVRGYAYEHRLVAEQKIGRRLRPGETIHHLNGCKSDNAPENIVVTSGNAEHFSMHRKRGDLRPYGSGNPMRQCECGCGKWFNAYDGYNRPRRFISGHNPPNRSKQTALIEAAGNGASLYEISARTGQSLRAVRVMASKLVRAGKLNRTGRGIYGRPNAHPVV